MTATERRPTDVSAHQAETIAPPEDRGDDDARDDLARLANEVAELREEIRALREAIERDRQRPRRSLPPIVGRCTLWLNANWERLPSSVRRAPALVRKTIVAGQARTEWAPRRALLWDVVAVIVIGIVAFLLRGINLTHIPVGLHGDEAATGLEARRIIANGWIGVYTGIAGGNPTGDYYLATIPIRLIEDPVVAVRMLSAIGGTIGVIALFVLVRRSAGIGSAAFASTLFAFAEWHIQFSRTGFVTGMWPTFVLIGTIALMEAVRTRSWYWWAVTGVLMSSGIYIYNAHGPFLMIAGAFVAFVLFGWRAVVVVAALAVTVLNPSLATIASLLFVIVLVWSRRFLDRRSWLNAVCFSAMSLLTLWKMLSFIRERHRDYYGRGQDLSVFKSPQWKATDGLIDKSRFLLDRYWEFWNRLTFRPIPDGVDLSGVTPLVPRVTFAICFVGLVIALIRRPTTLVLFSTAIVLFAPLTVVLTDMTMRRALVIVPFISVLGAIGMIETIRFVARKGRIASVAAACLAAGLIAISSWTNYTDFFDKTAASGPARHNFGVISRDTAEFLATLPDDAYVYFYSELGVLDYDSLKLIAPDVRGENRLPKWGGNGTLNANWRKGRPAFVFVGSQAKLIDTVTKIYPGGQIVTGPMQPAPLNGPSFVAYILDSQP